jgi:hypothetical protein
MTALGLSAGLCYILALAAFGGWLLSALQRTGGINYGIGNIALLGAAITLLIAASFIHGLRSKLDELIAAVSQRVDDAQRGAAWLVKPRDRS